MKPLNWPVVSQILLALGGVATLARVWLLPAERNKMRVDSGKVGVDTSMEVSSQAMQWFTEISDEARESRRERDAEAAYVRVLVQALRAAGIEVPPRPEMKGR